MNLDEFEKHLQSQPLRQVPAEWRQEILSVAQEAARALGAPHTPHYTQAPPSLLSTLNHRLSTFLWPHPAAWAGLAAVWLVILGLDLATQVGSPLLAQGTTPPSPQLFMAFQEQQRLLSELIGPREAPVAEQPKQAPLQPRSERRRDLQMA